MKELIAQLQAYHPQALPIFVAVLTGGVIHGWKLFFPKSFEQLDPKFKAYPATIVAAVMTAGITATAKPVNLFELTLSALFGGFSGLTAVGGHEFISRSKNGSKRNRAEKLARKIDTQDAELLERKRPYISSAETLPSRTSSKPMRATTDVPSNDPIPEEAARSTRGEDL